MRIGQLVYGIRPVGDNPSVFETLANNLGTAAINFGTAYGQNYLQSEFGGNKVPLIGPAQSTTPVQNTAAQQAAAAKVASGNTTNYLLFGGIALAVLLIAMKKR